jgi:protein gp37
MLPDNWSSGWNNVWLGTTAEDQARYDMRWKHLQGIPAVVRFISYEPAIGPIRLSAGTQPDWLISGGESGGKARPMNPQWARDIITDCRKLGVAAFHKQWGSYKNNPLVADEGMTASQAEAIDDHGKGGGLVDGQLIRNFPRARSIDSAAA